MSTKLCIRYPEMLVFTHTKLTTVSGHLMPCLETICITSYNSGQLHLTFFILSLLMSDAFCKSSFFLSYLTLLHGSDQPKLLLMMSCLVVGVSSVLP